MILRNSFRMGMITIGFGLVLLLGASARAQEIENTNWNDGPGAVPFAPPAPRQTANDFNSVAMNSDTEPAAVTIRNPVVTQAAVVYPLGPIEQWAMTFLLVCTALVALYALAASRRSKRHIGVSAGAIGGRDLRQTSV